MIRNRFKRLFCAYLIASYVTMIAFWIFLGTIYWDSEMISFDALFMLLMAPLFVPGIIIYGIANWAVVGYELHNNYTFYLLALLIILTIGVFFLLGHRRSEQIADGNSVNPSGDERSS